MSTKEEKRTYSKKYYEKNKEKRRASNAKWYAKNREETIKRARQWAINNPVETAIKQRKAQLKYRYGIEELDYEKMFSAQNGTCKICHQPEEYKKLCIDHDHDTGKVRGLLCGHCNKALGHMRDSSQRLRDAANYLLEIGSDEHLFSIINELGA